jgi:cell wall-associated NlpC family hydrolase
MRKQKHKIFSKISLLLGAVVILTGALASVPIVKSTEVELHEPVSASIHDSVDSVENRLSVRDSLDEFGKTFLGVPYVYGGTSEKGFDCSGFVYHVFGEFGIKVPRISSQIADFGKEIPIDSVKKGDILIFLSPTRNVIGHLGIVTEPNGMESKFIHASSGKEMQVMVSSLNQPNYTRRFVKSVTVMEN